MRENTRNQCKNSIVKLKKSLHFTTALVFFLQQLALYSSAFAMESDEDHTGTGTHHPLTVQKSSIPNDEDVKNFNVLLKEAKRGDARAQGALGIMYANGKGVEKNEKEAIRLFTLDTVS